jgi:hypothetical protein
MWEVGTGKIKGKNQGKKGAENVKDSHDNRMGVTRLMVWGGRSGGGRIRKEGALKQRTLDPVTLQQEGNGSGRFGLKKYGGLYNHGAGNLICSARKFN